MPLALLFDMAAGVSGDMALGGFFALGFDPHLFNASLRQMGLPVCVESETIEMHGLKAVRAKVICSEPNPPHRHLRDFLSLLESAPVHAVVKEAAASVFIRLAEAEAEIHGIPVQKVHFHEIGGMDTFVDVLGTALGLHFLGVARCFTTPFPFGRGTIAMEHGMLPEPAPATLLLTRGFPSYRTGWEGEHCTPTGAAIVTTFARPVEPEWTAVLASAGYGAGSRNPADRANVLRLCLYTETEALDASFQACQIECNLDNATPEQVGHALECLFTTGCLDAWQESIVMKKGRVGVKLCALTSWELRDAAMRVIAAETPTGGLRWFPVRRSVGMKRAMTADTPFGSVATKEVVFPAWALRHAHGEYESMRKAAREHGVPLRVVQDAVGRTRVRSGGEET